MSTTRYEPRSFSPVIRAGAGDSRIHAAFRQGRAVRLARGHYVPAKVWQEAPPWVRFELSAAAESLANPGTVFCGETAVFLHGLPVWVAPRRLELRVGTTSKAGRRPQVYAARGAAASLPRAPHRFAHVHPPAQRMLTGTDAINPGTDGINPAINPGAGDGMRPSGRVGVERAGHFLTVPLPQAVVEVLATQPLERSLVVADAALRAESRAGLSREHLVAVARRWPVKTQSSRALAVLSLASSLAESPGESRSRALLLEAGYDPPELQVEFTDDAGFIGRCDFWWPELGVVGEFDGRQKWAGALVKDALEQWEVVHAAQERHARLAAHPLVNRVVHWVSEDLDQAERLFTKVERAGVRVDPRRRLRAA